MNIRYDIAHLWGCKTAICIIQETFCVFRTSLSSEIVYCILSPLLMSSKLQELNINLWLGNCERGEKFILVQNTSSARVQVARI